MTKPTKIMTEDWRNLNKSWEEKLTHIFRCQYASDITIKICEDKNETSFKAHRFILSMSSEVFDAMLKAPVFKNPGEACLMLMNVNGPSFGLFLEYLYCKKIQFKTVKEAIGVYKIADKFNILELKNYCLQYIEENFSIENIMECVEFADSYRLEGLKQRAVEIIQKNTSKVINESNIHSLKIEWLMLILDQPTLSTPEPELFRLIHKWYKTCNAENECVKGQTQACLIPRFRFRNFKADEFMAGPVKSGLLTKNQSLAIIGHIIDDENSPLEYPEGFNKSLRGLAKEGKGETGKKDAKQVEKRNKKSESASLDRESASQSTTQSIKGETGKSDAKPVEKRKKKKSESASVDRDSASQSTTQSSTRTNQSSSVEVS